jgi:hypothetical protein
VNSLKHAQGRFFPLQTDDVLYWRHINREKATHSPLRSLAVGPKVIQKTIIFYPLSILFHLIGVDFNYEFQNEFQ